jgi:hypothetical protein
MICGRRTSSGVLVEVLRIRGNEMLGEIDWAGEEGV